MSDSYKHKFNVLEVFEKNNFQNILMGTKKDALDDVVVINVFKKGLLINEKFLNDLKSSLANLIHIEETDDEIIAVTEYKEGISFSNFLSTTNLNIDERVNLVHQYLTNLTNYDNFDNYFTNIFVDENQIISKNGQFHLNELLILDNGIDNATSFDKITSKIASTIKKIAITNGEVDESSQEFQKFTTFITGLKNNSASNSSIKSILNDFESIFSDKTFSSVKKSKSEPALISNLGILAASAVTANALKDNNTSDTLIETSNSDSPNSFDEVSDLSVNRTSLGDTNSEDLSNEDHVSEIPGQLHMDEVAVANDTLSNDTIVPTESPKVDNDDSSTVMKETELDNITIIDETPEETYNNDNSKKRTSVLIVLALALLAAFGLFVLPGLLAKDVPPIASFERVTSEDSIKFTNTSVAIGKNNEIVAAIWKVMKDEEEKYSSDNLDDIKLSFKSEGEYTVSLKVQDKNGLWSEEYAETIVSNPEETETTGPAVSETIEKLDSLSIDNTLSDNAIYDYEIFRSGDRSIKLDLNKNDGVAEFMINDIALDKNYMLSMWILSDKTDPITIEYTGYDGNKVVFVKEAIFTPKQANLWEMTQIKISSSSINKVKLKFTGLGSTIWIDDIDTNSYK